MSEISSELSGAQIDIIVLNTGKECSTMQGEYCSYELLVYTNKGLFRFAGCHDYIGDIEIKKYE
jgi:hypothetical protein